MKNIIKLLGLIVLITFSFFYTDKVINVIREEDTIMIELQNKKDLYKIDAINANISDNTIIPGLNGRVVNIDKSYKQLKQVGTFNKNSLVYDNITPSVSITNNKDKYIVKGNSIKQMVSIIFILENNNYLDSINQISLNKDITFNFFVDYNYLIENTTTIKELANNEFYTYGSNGKYTPDNLLFSNNLISRISNNSAIYCLNEKKDNTMLELCNKNDLYTITPTLVIKDNAYNKIKNNLESGSIILLKMTKDNVNNLELIIDYIKGKGMKIEGLSKLLTEDSIID